METDIANALETNSTAAEIQSAVDAIAQMPSNTRLHYLLGKFLDLLPKLLTAALILLVGIILVRWAAKFARNLLKHSRLDVTLHNFIVSILSALLYILLAIIVVTVLVPSAVGSLITMFGVFGLAVSLAVKDSLANLAGGMSVLFTKPFALGDYVNINGNEGTVQEIRLNYTVIKTVDNKLVHIPNGDVAKAEITNFTAQETRRLDLVFSIGYDDDFEQAKKIIREIVHDNPLAHSAPEPIVRMVEHGDSAIRIGCRVWVDTADYWTLNYDLLEEVKRRFDASGIHIPYNQLEIAIRREP
ncbi:mechanosensitive ion channel family protein [Anaerotruncus colihominis]|jgi:small conductance mechanosensitive channel|uniref:Small-conductance mechanosensitive channel n=1 Tax=Anaerotruncus colihominis TaxID=169435 RepID=A0A174MCV4_9FIRM|nr:mechanosensitive ion channel family protein [Anaerotruncus colihominis]MBS4987499.1 mechanosensitive ion channel family protein [Anaerotruncus colihominis]MCQ4732381.1 mechanosensitive ion channel family protein [Anaerotruncus colihominis]CUP33126.1 Small-conductance mechanosensitive channel [Anaerotruncus colihominis]